MKRRFLSTLMALVLALSLIPTAALAVEGDETQVAQIGDKTQVAQIGDKTYTSLSSAMFDFRANDTLVLLANCETNYLQLPNNSVIDLKGHNLTYTGSTRIIFSGSGRETTITDSTASSGTLKITGQRDGSQSVFEIGNATLNVNNINIESTGCVFYPRGNSAELNITNCNITTEGVYCVSTNAGDPAYYGVTINIVGSSLTANADDKDDCAVMMNVSGSLNIEDSVITGNRQGVFARAGNVTIVDSKIIVTGEWADTEAGKNYNEKWQSGNEVPTSALIVGNSSDNANSYNADARATISNTVITAPRDSSVPAIYVDANSNHAASVSVSGSETVVTGDITNQETSGKASIVVTGGTFLNGDNTVNTGVKDYFPEGSSLKIDEETGEVVTDDESTVAEVGGVPYKSLQAAIDEAASGDTVTLLKDIASGAAIKIGLNQDLTLDLGGNTLTVEKTVPVVDYEITGSNVNSFPAHIVNNGESLVIKNGTIVGCSAAAVIANRSGTLEIKSDATIQSTSETYNNSAIIENLGGTVETSGQLISTANCGIRTYGGTVNMTGGSIEARYFDADQRDGGSGLTIFNRGYNNESAGAKVTISGGTIDAAVFAISTNNLYSGGGNPSNLTITGGTVTAVESSTIYWPSAGTLTIGTKGSTSGPTINSPKGSSVEICSGTLNVYGGTLNGGTEMTSDDSYATDQSLVNGYRKNSGSAGTGDAVTVISRRGSGYDTAQLNVNIEGGTFTSPQNYGVRYMDCNLAESETKIEQTVDVKITGGSFDGGIAAVDAEFVKEDDKDFISGGNYSNSVIDYLTDDMTAQLYSTSDPETPYSYYRDVAAAQNAAGPNDVITDFSPDVGTSVTYYTITLNNGDTVYNKYFIKANGSFTLPSAPSGSSNQRFDGWSLYGNLYQPGQTFTVTKPMTFDAMWTEVSSSGSGSSDPSYSPVLDVSDGGTIKVSPRTPEAGDKVTITPDPDNGYEVGEVTVTDRSGDAVRVTANRDGTYTFTQPRGRVTIEVTFVRAGESAFFDDVPASFWAYDEIAWAYDNGYVNGTSAATFSPNSSITRQQVWMILARLSGADPASMAAAREWAMVNDISDGTNPGNAVTRQQLVALLYRYAQLMGYDNSAREALSSFPDAGTVSGYAQEPMQWSVANGIVAGTSAGTLNPTGTATRAQFAVILYRFWDQVG